MAAEQSAISFQQQPYLEEKKIVPVTRFESSVGKMASTARVGMGIAVISSEEAKRSSTNPNLDQTEVTDPIMIRIYSNDEQFWHLSVETRSLRATIRRKSGTQRTRREACGKIFDW